MARVATLWPDGMGPWTVTDSPGRAVPGRSAHWATTMLSAGLRRTVNCGVDIRGPRIAGKGVGAQRRFARAVRQGAFSAVAIELGLAPLARPPEGAPPVAVAGAG